MRVPLDPFHLADASSFTFRFARSNFSVANIATPLYIFRRHMDMALIETSFSKITFFNCSFYILKQFSSSSERTHSASTLLSVVGKALFSASPAKGASILTSITGAMAPVAKPLPVSIKGYEFDTSSFSIQKTCSLGLRALPRIHDPKNQRARPPRPS